MPNLVRLTQNIIDGDFSFPVEVEGSPLITTDEVTKAKLVVRKYAVLTSAYVPLSQGVADSQYTNCYLLNETPASIQGPILFFNRNYCQVPSLRVENRVVAFTRPGVSSIQVSQLTAAIIGWNQYGQAAPFTGPRLATVTYEYFLGSQPSVPAVTVITFNGSPVDFTGVVFNYVGNRTTTVDGKDVTEPNWSPAGFTNPSIPPINWIVETSVRRWRGPIFETEVVRVFG